MRSRISRIGGARLFEPNNRLLGARLQQMNHANSPVPITDVGITRAEADGLLLGRKRLLCRPGVKFARAECG